MLPDPGTAGAPAAGPVLVFARAIDHSELVELARDFNLPPISFVASNEAVPATTLPLRTVDGHLVGALAWQPEGVGTAMIRSLMAPTGIAFLALALLSVAVLTLIERSRRQFDEQLRLSEERFRIDLRRRQRGHLHR